MREVVSGGGTFRSRIDVTDPKLRACMGLKPGQGAHFDVQVRSGSFIRA